MSCEEHKVFGLIEILFDFLKNRKYNDYKRVASKRKSSLPAARYAFFCAEKERSKQNGGKQ